MKNTVNTTKIIGHQDYINKDTGEMETMQVISIEERNIRKASNTVVLKNRPIEVGQLKNMDVA